MNRIEFSEFFTRYLDPHKAEVAEWGAFAGMHGRDRESALGRVKKLAETAVARAGLGSPARLSYAQKRLTDIESVQSSISQRWFDAYHRLTGAGHFSSTRIHRILIEGLIDLLALPCLPIAMLAVWPFASLQRWNCSRLERAEGAITRMSKAAEDYLIIEFEWHFEKGGEARRIRASNSKAGCGPPPAGAG
jgi:hypothetical protein